MSAIQAQPNSAPTPKPDEPTGLNDSVRPADKNAYYSPAEVMRRVGHQLNGNFRRTFGPHIDVVTAGLLSESTAQESMAV